jgi:hypothetical protein
VCYKDATRDPYALDLDASNDHLVTVRWRATPVNLPEDTFVGVMYVYDPVDADIVIENAQNWVCNGTGLRNGDRLPGLLGYEVDSEFGNQPVGTERIAHSAVPNTTITSDMTVYTAASGATVFATGSMYFNWGLDDYNSPGLHTNRVNAAAQQMTRNVLASMLGHRPLPAPTPLAAPTQLTAKSPARQRIALTWVDNSTNEQSFRIERSLSATSGFAELASVGANVSSFTETNVRSRTSYYYRARAANATQVSSYYEHCEREGAVASRRAMSVRRPGGGRVRERLPYFVQNLAPIGNAVPVQRISFVNDLRAIKTREDYKRSALAGLRLLRPI